MKTVAELTDLFRREGLRVTPQRQAIFGLLQNEETHPTVEALYDQARLDMPTISLKTVYQTVHDLEALGEVFLGNLDGDSTIQPRVAGFVHLAHPTRADGRENFVGSEAGSRSQRHGMR